MGNKFLERYPVLWEPSIGDCVVVVRLLDINKKSIEGSWYYKIGDIGEIINTADRDLYTIKFSHKRSHLLYREEFEYHHTSKSEVEV